MFFPSSSVSIKPPSSSQPSPSSSASTPTTLIVTGHMTPSFDCDVRVKKVPSIAMLNVDNGSSGGGSGANSPRKNKEGSSPSRYSPLSLISPRKKSKNNKDRDKENNRDLVIANNKEKEIIKENNSNSNVSVGSSSKDQSPLISLSPGDSSTGSMSPSSSSPSNNQKYFESMDSMSSITASLSDHQQSISNNPSAQPSPLTSPEEFRNQYKPLPCEPDLLPISSPPPSHHDEDEHNQINQINQNNQNNSNNNSNVEEIISTKKKGIFSGLFSRKKEPKNLNISKSLPQTPLPSSNQQPQQMSKSFDSIKTSGQQQQQQQYHPSLLPPVSLSHYAPISPIPVTSPLKTSILHNRNRGVSSLNNSGQYPRKSSSQIDLGGSGIIGISVSSTPKHQSLIMPANNNIYSPTFLPPHLAYSSQSVATDATWLMIVSNWSEWSEPHFRPLLTKYVYQGIPDRFRPTIWFHLSNMIPQLTTIPACIDLTTKHNLVDKAQILTPLSTPSTVTPTNTPGLKSQNNHQNQNQQNQQNNITSPSSPSSSSPTTTTTNILNASGGSNHHKCFYHSILKHHSEHEEQIDVDIQRSFCEVSGELRDNYSIALANVLRAISLYDPELGYCQGISFVGSIMVQKVQEEETFHILLRLLEGVMRDFYTIGMRGLKLRVYQISKLVQELFPKLHQHLEKIDLDYTIFASPWFLTAFSYHLSEECVERIIDIILLQGVEAFFSVGLAIFQIIQDDLLACADNSQVMEYFRTNAKEKIDPITLMDTAGRIGISSKQLYVFQQQFEREQKPNIPSEFNPDQTPKEKMKDPNWVVKKYKLKERINNLEEDLAVMKHDMHHTVKRYEEEKIQLVRHLQDVTDRESGLLQAEVNYQNSLRDNQDLKSKLQQAEELNRYLAEEMRKMRTQMDNQIWNNNPKKSIQWS
ncbi:RabGAP/TBC domain-containing protein [Cavenderia fasciculata]|uniref:RabGAP/TBC domain-containing protein n=1 Tax=Cavenderia fasciculata TaxID=261658 RepID=F4Q5U6_CACFS|nr:RabGAP/TBC domain-containing protein [Cavenderia fasciculata]EGG17355.1 RabGAP/TBC domain-containing protein [Cavenderia fasciculata]|eukprot:XP_004355839.1 RabGAP/TBC domain-containing protein [Cavenderia fasciculata]